MSQTTVNVRMDEDLKKDFDGVCNELGITMSTAIIMLAKKMTRGFRSRCLLTRSTPRKI